MTYEDFVVAYETLLHRLFDYTPDQVGSHDYCSKLADLVDAHPAFEARYDAAF
jgi:hypothetical protein